MKTYCIVLLAGAIGFLAFGQEPQVPPVIQIQRESIKEGRGSAHEKVEVDFARASHKYKGMPNYLALTSMTGPNEVWFVTAYPSFAAVEQAEKAFEKPPMKTEFDMLDARDGELRAGSRGMYAVLRPDMSYHLDKVNLSKTRYFALFTARVKIGHDEELSSGAKVLYGAQEKAGIAEPAICYQVVAGAPDGMYLFFGPMESLQAWDKMPENQRKMAEAMGAENFAKFMKGAGDLFATMQTDLMAVNPRMSFVSKAIEDGDPGFWRTKPAAATKPAETTKPGQ